MHLLIEKLGLLPGGLLSALVIFLRYTLFAGTAYAIFYVWRKHYWQQRKIQAKLPSWSHMRHEMGHSLTTAIVFALVGLGIYGMGELGWTRIYADWSAFGGSSYLLFSFVLLVVLHDTYFYWMHRWMHHPRLFRIFHLVHHKSNNPTPWASLAFHPLEALVEIAVVPLLVLLIPFHPAVLLAFATWSLLWNVIGHLGYEIFPTGWVDHPLLKYLNTSTHHNLHHHQSKGNYSLYFNWWDRWMGTMHPEYEVRYREVTGGDSVRV